VSGASEKASNSARQDRGVDLAGLLGGPTGNSTLDELALHGVQGCQRRMPALQLAKLGLDPEELTDEIFQVRGQFDDQLGLGLRRQPRRVPACRFQSSMEFRGAVKELIQEGVVQLEQALSSIKIAKLQPEPQGTPGAILHENCSICD